MVRSYLMVLNRAIDMKALWQNTLVIANRFCKRGLLMTRPWPEGLARAHLPFADGQIIWRKCAI